MGKASSSKKVARAARVGAGARRARASRSYFWPGFLTAVVVLGTVGVVFSRNQRETAAAPIQAPTRDNSPPRVGDHWHSAYGVNICGKFATPVDDQTDPFGIHTHADGVIHAHPFRIKGRPFTGKNATLGSWLKVVDGRISPTSFKFPGSAAKKNGDKCGKKVGEVQVVRWANDEVPVEQGEKVADPANLRLTDRELITIAFLPKGETVPQPPSAPRLHSLTDVEPSPTTPAPGEAPPSSEPAGEPGAEPAATPPPEIPTTAPPAETPTSAP
jgi:hypothetical protein